MGPLHGWDLPWEAFREAGDGESSPCGFPKERRVIGNELMGAASISTPLCLSDNVCLNAQPRSAVNHWMCKEMVALP